MYELPHLKKLFQNIIVDENGDTTYQGVRLLSFARAKENLKIKWHVTLNQS